MKEVLMDPLTSIVTALAAGAAAALQSTVEQGVKDGYTALKGLIQRKYAQVNLDYAAERLFLRKVGGGYIFLHRRLQAYFAILHTELSGSAPPPETSAPG
jgi:hypothetical protein